MKNFKSIVLVFTIVIFASCKKNDTVKEFSKSEGFGANVYLEAQSDILLAGNSFKMPVTYWLPNTEIDSLSLRETKDSTIELSFKQIAGSTFAYGTQFFGNIDSNKVYSVYTHTEDNWSDAHYSYRLHADYNSDESMSAVYREKFAEVNEFLTQPGANTDSILNKLAYDYATQMTKDQLHRSIVSITTQEEFDALWGGLKGTSASGAQTLYDLYTLAFYFGGDGDGIDPFGNPRDEMLKPYNTWNDFAGSDVKDLYKLSGTDISKLYGTKRPVLIKGHVQFNDPETKQDTMWLESTPYFDLSDETEALKFEELFSDDILTPEGEIVVANSILYESNYSDDFKIEYLLSERKFPPTPGEITDPVYDKDLLHDLLVDYQFVTTTDIFDSYFSNDMVNESSIPDLMNDILKLPNGKLFGYKPKAKRLYNVTLEFQVRGKDGVIGKSNVSKFNVK